MLTLVSELAQAARKMNAAAFEAQFGPAALLLSPGKEATEQASMRLGVLPTQATSSKKNYLDDLLLMLRAFTELAVFFLSPQGAAQAISIGRSPDCQVLLEDPSVSKVHAHLLLGPGGWQLRDENSRNGTFINDEQLGAGAHLVTDGDTLGFGEAQLIFVTAKTLQAQLAAIPLRSPH